MTATMTLTWKLAREGNGALVLTHDSKRYLIQSITATTYQLSINNKPALKGTKEACKSYVLDLISRKPVPTITPDMLKPSKGGVITWQEGAASGLTTILGEKGLMVFVMIYQPVDANWKVIHNHRTLWTGSIEACKKVCETVIEQLVIQTPNGTPWMIDPKPKSKTENVLNFLHRAARYFGDHPNYYLTSEALCKRANLDPKCLRDPEVMKQAKVLTFDAALEYANELNQDSRRLGLLDLKREAWFGDTPGKVRDTDVAFADRYAAAVSKAASGGAAGGESSPGTSDRPTGSAAQSAAQLRKKPGVIAKLLEVLRTASAKQPMTKEQILTKLVEAFPERDQLAMKSTVGSQIPCGLKTEKNITCTKVGSDGWYISDEGK
jgi:hypothetical protein